MAFHQRQSLKRGHHDAVFDGEPVRRPPLAKLDEQPFDDERLDGVEQRLLRTAELVRHRLLGRIDARAVVAGLVGEQRKHRLTHWRAQIALIGRRNEVIAHVRRLSASIWATKIPRG